MTEQDDAAQAAGNAAYDRAAQSSWPPTEDDFRATGAAAGAAVGTVFGGAVGAAIGTVVGEQVGAFVYGLGDAIAEGLDANRGAGDAPMYARYIRTTVGPSPLLVARRLRLQCKTSVKAELAALRRRGVPITPEGYADIPGEWYRALQRGGVTAARPMIEAWQRKLYAATAARIAECETYIQTGGSVPNGSSGGIVKVGIGLGLLWALVKAVT